MLLFYQMLLLGVTVHIGSGNTFVIESERGGQSFGLKLELFHPYQLSIDNRAKSSQPVVTTETLADCVGLESSLFFKLKFNYPLKVLGL